MVAYGQMKQKFTAELIIKINKFFDCCNTRSLTEGQQRQKTFLKPYASLDDERFEFLDNFLKYLVEWKEPH